MTATTRGNGAAIAGAEPDARLASSSQPHESTKVCRLGSFLLLSDAKQDEARALEERLVAALRKDSRVDSAEIPEPDAPPGFADIFSFFPAVEPRDEGEPPYSLIFGTDQRRSVQLWNPILLTLHVPAKNQPNDSPFDAVASEDYVALWDGWITIVGWSQAKPEEVVPFAGGQVLEDVLRRATQAADADLYVQACAPHCTHLFNHTNVVVERDGSVSTATYVPTSEPTTVKLLTPDPVESPEDAAAALYFEIASTAESFAQMKNIGRRILDLETSARGHLLGLMRLQYSRVHVWEHPLRDRPKLLWSTRGWRRTSRINMARLWVIVTAIEEIRREWADYRRRYLERMTENESRRLIFAIDEADDVSAVNSLDTAPIQTGIAEASDRLDRGALILATFGVAIAAVLGVVVGHFL